VGGEIYRLLGIDDHMTSAYHPEADVLAERFPRQLKDSCQAGLCGRDWLPATPPLVLLGLSAATEEHLAISAAERVNLQTLTLTGQFLEAKELSASDFMDRLRDTGPPSQYSHTASTPAGDTQDVLFKDLMQVVYIYIRGDRSKPPFSQE
jgi:hypothetical protein